MNRGNLSLEIKSAVRRRILMDNSGKELVIYEGELATEFGVSRTPIRQVIQSLAAEALVEVRSGVGTVATPLLPEYRINDMQSFSAILTACKWCAVQQKPSMILSEFSASRMYLAQVQDEQLADVFFDVSNKFIVLLEGLVEDKVLRVALIACYWRYLRRRVAEHGVALEPCIDELDQLLESAEEGAKLGQAEQILVGISSAVNSVIRAKS